jgi:transcriptional regulator with XRE-family HTH domain
MTLAQAVAEALTTARQRAGITQKELARRAGMAQQNVSRIESGTHANITVETLRRLAAALGRSVEIVFH